MQKLLFICLVFVISMSLSACGSDELPAIKIDADIEFYESFTSEPFSNDKFDVNDEVYVKMKFIVENPHEERHQFSYEIIVPNAQNYSIKESETPNDIEVLVGDFIDDASQTTTFKGNYMVDAEDKAESQDIWFVFRGLRAAESKISINFSSESAVILGSAQSGSGKTIEFVRNLSEVVNLELSPIRLDKTSERLTWNIINDSLSAGDYAYSIKLNRTDEPFLVSENENYQLDFYDLSTLPAGQYRFDIIALSTSVSENVVLDSNLATILFSRLETPNLLFNNGEADWNDIPSANGYVVNIDSNTTPKYPLESSLKLDFLPAGNHSISVQATSTNAMILNSKPSPPKIASKFDAPIIESTGVRIIWNDLNNVTRYKVFIDGKFHTETQEPSFDLIPGNYMISVVAHSTVNNIIDSNPSNAIEIDIGG